MLDLDCKICFVSFDGKEHLPRILICGHSFCSECISKLLQSTNCCPNCRMTLPERSFNAFPVNYLVLEIMESKEFCYDPKEEYVQNFSIKLTQLKEDYSNLKVMLKTDKKKIDLNLNMIANAEKSLVELLKVNDPFDKKSLAEIKKLEKQYEELRSDIMPDDPILQDDVSILSTNYASTADYLAEIYKGILQDKKFVAVLKINNISKHAKLSVRDNYLFIHAFEEGLKDEDLNSVCFRDLFEQLLKKIENKSSSSDLTVNQHVQQSFQSFRVISGCYSSADVQNIASINGFLDLTYGSDGFCQRAIIEVFKSSTNLASQFLKLCTGEAGFSYKGCDYQQNLGITLLPNNHYNHYGHVNNGNNSTQKIIELNNFGKVLEEFDVISRYFLVNNESKLSCQVDKCCLQFESDGSFAILNNAHNNLQLTNIIGTVANYLSNDFNSLFANAQQRKIIDCGIAIRM